MLVLPKRFDYNAQPRQVDPVLDDVGQCITRDVAAYKDRAKWRHPLHPALHRRFIHYHQLGDTLERLLKVPGILTDHHQVKSGSVLYKEPSVPIVNLAAGSTHRLYADTVVLRERAVVGAVHNLDVGQSYHQDSENYNHEGEETEQAKPKAGGLGR